MTETSQTENQAPEPEREQTLLQKLTPLLTIAVVGGILSIRFPSMALQVVSFILTLGVLVFVHELGHYQVARWAGMKVNRFGIGFPPWIFTHRHKGIDYSIGALPIGGMVDIAGLGSEEEMMGTATTGDLPENTRNPNAPHGQKNFQDANLGWRFATLFAGPLMNFIFAIGLAVFLLCVAGIPSEKSRYVNYVEKSVPGKAAAKAGIQSGDVLIKINGVDVSNVQTADDYKAKIEKPIRTSAGKPITIVLKRNGQILTKSVTPILDIADDKKKTYMLGIQFGYDPSRFVYERLGFTEAVTVSLVKSKDMAMQILTIVGHAVTIRMTPEERNGIQGVVGIGKIVGETAKQSDWRNFAMIVVSISLNLGLMNLLPIPALDGGRILFLGYELIMRKPFDPRKEGIVHMAGMVLLLAFMLFIAFRDVVRIWG